MLSLCPGMNRTVIKLDEQEKLLRLNKSNITVQLYEGYFTLIHHQSKSFGTHIYKKEAYLKLINSQNFKIWYNKEISKILGYDHLPFHIWDKFTKNIVFQIMKNNKWTNVDEDFFFMDFYNI